MTTAAKKRKENRQRALEKNRALKIKQLRQGNKITTRSKVDGKIVKKDSYYGGNKISNTPKEGTRAGLLGMKGQGMGADYNKTEKEAFKKAEDWQKSDEKKKITENYKKGNKNTGGGNKGGNGGGNGGGSNNNKLKVRKGKSSIEQENRDRFGDAHVDKLKQKQVDFKKMKKKQMTKAEFIKKYPKSITAQKAKGLRR
jgi:hypothetical protein